jgi:hemoglobin
MHAPDDPPGPTDGERPDGERPDGGDTPPAPRPTAATTPMGVAAPGRKGAVRPAGAFGPPPGSSARTPAPDTDDAEEAHQVTIYAAVGGQPFFDRLADAFYRRVATDEVLLPLYPDPDDLGPAAERLALFLGQYWGGPATYSERRGHPRLRMRHAPFVIGETERDHWLESMLTALEETMPSTPLDDELRDVVAERMRSYVTLAADHLVNAG